MSIVQDALKKIKNEPAEGPGNRLSPKHPTGIKLLLFVVLLAGVAFAGNYAANLATSHFSRMPVNVKVKPPASAPEMIYKPVVSVEINNKKVETNDKSANKLTNPFAGFIIKPKEEFPDIILSGIMQLVNGPRAIINNVMVGVGDVIDGMTVHKIEKEKVTLKKGDAEVTVAIK